MSLADGLASGVAAALTAAIGAGHPFRVKELFGVYTATGNITLTNQARNVHRIDPGGSARDLTLPALENGLVYLIANAADAAETITVKNAAAATIVALAQNEAGLVWCDGSAWYYVQFSAPA